MKRRSKAEPEGSDPSPGIFARRDPQLHRDFLKRLERDRAAIQSLLEELARESVPNEATLSGLELHAHQLHGTAAMFGMKHLSAAAGALQHILHGAKPPMDSSADERVRSGIEPLIEPLIEALIDALDRELTPKEPV